MGKNTVIRKILRDRAEHLKENSSLDYDNTINMLEMVKGNIGFVFIPDSENIATLKNELTNDKTKTAAKAGMFAPVNVIVPAGPTNQDPSQTSFFQALDIPTKISRGQIEIISDVELIQKGKKVEKSAAELLVMLGIKPFYFGVTIHSVYDKGDIYPSAVLDITDDSVGLAFNKSLQKIASFSLALNIPTACSIPHSILNAYRNICAVGLGCDSYSWDKLDKVKILLANPTQKKIETNSNNEIAVKDATETKKEEESSVLGATLFNESSSSNNSSEELSQ